MTFQGGEIPERRYDGFVTFISMGRLFASLIFSNSKRFSSNIGNLDRI